jgi:transcriptional regulator GlxA family with amidase domain
MHRRHFLGSTIAASIALFGSGAKAAPAAAEPAAPLPKRRRVRVAFMLGDHANVIDTCGPWEVFQDAESEDGAFELCTVAPEEGPLEMTGGLKVLPTYSIRNAPQPNVIVVPAQKSTAESRAWLAQASAGTDVTMSVCTGAFQLARAGLLKGVAATTHHQFFDSFAKEFPDMDSGRIATAGGLTSGIDLALHIVSRYFGVEAAQATAQYMEYTSEAWRA